MRRAVTSLTVQRLPPGQATEQNTLNLTVAAVPQPGGVRLKVRGNDLEGVQERQAAWIEWSETLPKKREASTSVLEAASPCLPQWIITPKNVVSAGGSPSTRPQRTVRFSIPKGSVGNGVAKRESRRERVLETTTSRGRTGFLGVRVGKRSDVGAGGCVEKNAAVD